MAESKPSLTPVTPSGSGSDRSRNPSSNSQDSSFSPGAGDSEGPLEAKANPLCMICATPKIVKSIQRDLAFIQMVQLHWTLLGIDCKPEECAKADLCLNCFRDLERVKEGNEMTRCLEIKFARMRLQFLKDLLVRYTWEMPDGSEGDEEPEVVELKKKLKAQLLEKHGQGDFLGALEAQEAELDLKGADYTIEAMMIE